MSKRSNKPTGLPVIHDRAAGIDIGSRFHVVGVPPELCDEPVQTFVLLLLYAASQQGAAHYGSQRSIASKLAPDWHQLRAENKKVSRR